MRLFIKALVPVIGLVVAVLGLVTAWIQLNKETLKTPATVIVVATPTLPPPQAPQQETIVVAPTPLQQEGISRAVTSVSPTSAPSFVQVTQVTGIISWRHNPDLPGTQGYPGAVRYMKDDYPGNSDSDWVYGIPLSVNSEQILLIAGYSGRLQQTGEMGGATHCFLLITRGEFNATIDLLAAGVEVHDVTPEANSLVWAAQKAKELRGANSTCAQEIDIWIGR